MGVWGVDFLHSVIYKWITYILVCWVCVCVCVCTRASVCKIPYHT